MRMVLVVSALCVGFIAPATAHTIQGVDGPPTSERPAATRLSQNLPSEVEQRQGIRPNSANPERRGGGRGGGYEGERRRGYGGGYEVERRRGYGGPDVDRCEGIAYQRGLVGRDFRRFVRYCMER
jgi:hypothetical protein